MSNFTWEQEFRTLFDRCVGEYKGGNTDFNSYYNDDDRAFLESIGYKPREFFDFVEDYADEGLPTPETAVLVAAVRRDFLHSVQDGNLSDAEISNGDLPARDAELGGLLWLPRILAKARAKLRGELDPEMMFS